jgi:hypothetical protein
MQFARDAHLMAKSACRVGKQCEDWLAERVG